MSPLKVQRVAPLHQAIGLNRRQIFQGRLSPTYPSISIQCEIMKFFRSSIAIIFALFPSDSFILISKHSSTLFFFLHNQRIFCFLEFFPGSHSLRRHILCTCKMSKWISKKAKFKYLDKLLKKKEMTHSMIKY